MKYVDTCLFGDVRAELGRLIADGVRVNTIVTSPPYWGLRSYCAEGDPAKRHEIGSEPTLAEYLRTMVEVFELCRQVLRGTGTLWLNMGDSYANDGKWGGSTGGKHRAALRGHTGVGRQRVMTGLKPKDLIGQPWRLAFALQDAGWWLRQDIIWHKPNPMPESITDRCTKAHEYIFLMAKSPRYYFDAQAISEPVNGDAHARGPGNKRVTASELYAAGDEHHRTTSGLVAYAERTRAKRKLAAAGSGTKNNSSFDQAMAVMPERRNRRSVWSVTSEPYAGAHFAAFPTKLIEPCILAGCPPGGIVLDPFFGSGTTGQVAQALGRHYIGIELNRANEALQRERLR